jgi:hypothetical protein
MPELEDFETLADDVRASAPQPREAFVARLDKRVDAGFPKPRAARERSWFWSPALALAACTVVTLVIAVGVLSGGSGTDESQSGGGGAMSAESGGAAAESAPAPEADESASAPPELEQRAAPASPVAPGRRRLVERRTSLELQTGRDEFSDVTAGVLRIADSTGSIVQRSNVTERDGRGLATYDLRVPSSNLDEALAELSELADVTQRSAASDDITAPYVSARDRLDDAREERRALLRSLGRADSEAEADALRARIRDARARIARAERDVRRLRARSDRARVDVIVRSTGRISDGGAWTPGDALDDAARVLEVAAGVTLVAGAVLLPFAILLALAAAAARVTRRRRREAALG